MKLSVIIPCFNAAKTIAVQLEALANQHWSQPWEVIVADNGSADETVAIVENYKKKLPNLRVVDASAQRGAAHARNIGAASAASNSLAFCDADDEVAPGWVKAMGKALSKYDFVACKHDYNKLNEPWTLKYRTLPQLNGLNKYNYPPFLSHASSSGLGIRRSIHELINGFDESMLRLQDTDYCWRVQLTGVKLYYVPDAVVHYRLRDTLEGLYHQSRLWGEHNVLLYKQYRPLGMPQLSLRISVKNWLILLKSFPKFFWNKEARAKWVWDFGWRIGRLQGSIKYKVLAL